MQFVLIARLIQLALCRCHFLKYRVSIPWTYFSFKLETRLSEQHFELRGSGMNEKNNPVFVCVRFTVEFPPETWISR
jgi:hypothetical protein